MTGVENEKQVGNAQAISSLNKYFTISGLSSVSDDEFGKAMQDSAGRQAIYDILVKRGLDVGDYDKFSTDFGFGIVTPEPEEVVVEPVDTSAPEQPTSQTGQNVTEVITEPKADDESWRIGASQQLAAMQQRLGAGKQTVSGMKLEAPRTLSESIVEQQKAMSNPTNVMRMAAANPEYYEQQRLFNNIQTGNIGDKEYAYLNEQRDNALAQLSEYRTSVKKYMDSLPEKELYWTNFEGQIQLTEKGQELVSILDYIGAAEKQYKSLVTKEDYKRNGGKAGFWAGFSNVDLGNTLSLGYGKKNNQATLAKIIQKHERGEQLTDYEQLAINAFGTVGNLEMAVNGLGGATTGYTMSKGLVDTLPFIFSMALTGGISNAAGKGAATFLLGKNTGKLVAGAGRMFATGTTNFALSPQFGAANTYDSMISEFEQFGALSDTPMWKRFAKGYGQSYAEFLSEASGGILTSYIKGVTPKVGFKRWLRTKFKLTNNESITKFLEHMQWSGTLEEFEEEMFNNLIQPLFTGENAIESWEESFSPENLKTTAGTVLLTSVAMGAPVVAIQGGSALHWRSKANTALKKIEDSNLRQTLYDAVRLESTEDVQRALAAIDWQNQDTSDIQNAAEYVNYHTYAYIAEGAEMSEVAKKEMSGKIAIIEGMAHEGIVRTAEYEGQPVYVTQMDSAGASIIMRMDGTQEQVATSSLKNVEDISVQEVIESIYAQEAPAIEQGLNEISEEGDMAEAEAAGVEYRPSSEVQRAFDEQEGREAPASGYQSGEVVSVDGKEGEIVSVDPYTRTARVEIDGVPTRVSFDQISRVGQESEVAEEIEAPEVDETQELIVEQAPSTTQVQTPVAEEVTTPVTEEAAAPVAIQPITNEAGELDIRAMGEEQTAQYVTESGDTDYVESMLADRRKKLEKLQKNNKLPLNLAERQKAIAERNAEKARLEEEISMWEGVQNRLSQPQQSAEVESVATPEAAPVESVEQQAAQAVEAPTEVATAEAQQEITPEQATQAEVQPQAPTVTTATTASTTATANPHTQEQVEAMSFEVGVVMNDAARAMKPKSLDWLNKVAQALGVRIAFVDDVEGGLANGLYNRNTESPTIYIAANRTAGEKFVIGHEMLHRMAQVAPDAYKAYKDFVLKELGDQEVNARVRIIINQYREADLPLPSAETLAEEVVADFTGDIISAKGQVFEGFAKKIARKDTKLLRAFRNAVEHIRSFFKKGDAWEQNLTRRLKQLDKLLAESVKAVEKGSAPSTENEGQAAPSLRESTEVGKVAQKIDTAIAPTQAEIEVAEAIPNKVGAEAMFSLRIADALEERSRTYFSRYYGGKNASAQYRPVARAIDEEALKIGDEAISAMVEIMAPHLDDVVFGKRLLPEEVYGKGYTTIFKNGSYGRSMENTTNCVRTLAYNEFTDEVKKQIGRPLTTAESFLASQMLYDIAKDPQCLYCYVSLDRKAYDEFLLRYMQERDVMLKQYAEMEDKSPEAMENLYNTYLNGRKDTKPMRERFNKLISIVDNGGTLISGYELMTREKRNEMRETSEDMRWQIEDAEKYAQGASWAKKEEEYRAYAGEILKMPFSVVRQLSEEYGLRFYSFSEYTPAFIVENMQMVRDAALRGLRGFAYTKEVDFVKIFAPTGMNMNVSTFGRVDSEGNVVPDERQGASWEEVKALREQYPNVGATFVATDDRMVEWALAQEWIDVVIPFHIVRTGADVAEFYKWTNYSSQQSDIKDGRKADIMPTEHHNDLETYLALCDERGITPRFNQWRENPNYMKLVNETRRSVDETPVLQPTFNLEAAKESWNNFVEKGGYYGGWYEVDEQGFNEAVEQVASDIEAGKSAKDVDYGRQDIPADYAERARQARVNRAHGNTPRLSLREMDAPYLEAVERGDMETAQRMVMEAAKIAMPNTKVVDEDGNPKVVYHQTNASVYINRETGQNWDELDWRERMEWDERDDWDDYWEEREFNTFSRVNARTTNEFDGFFFAPEYDEYHEYGDRTIAAFVNIENPASRGDYNIDSSKNNAGREERIRLQNEGYDGVIREFDGVVDEYIAFEPNQIKSADPVTYDDAGNVIPLSERFNPRKADIRYSLIGEKGARNLDIAEEATIRLDNLALAREMEQAGKDAKTIKMATGWERGADYFWRYEVDDVRLVNPEEWVNKKGKLTLKDIVTNADELFAAYPELKDVKIKKSTAMGNGGAYNHKDKTITISVGTLRRGFEIQNNVEGFNTSKEKIDRLMDILINVELRGTLVHEIQHAIQNIEDFARGGNAHMVNPALNKTKVVAFEQEMINQINEKVHQYNSMSTMERRTPKGSQLRVQIQEGKKKLAKFQKEIVLGKEGYRKLAGEVEARNIEKRLGLNPEERRGTLAEATEDVARDDQIFILYGAEMAEKKKIAEETVSPKDSDHPAAISSATGAKILNNLDNLAKKYQEKTNRPDTFIGDVARALDIEMRNKPSKYGTYLTISGDLITLRLSNHGATVSEFDARNEEEAISIVIDNKYRGGANDGNAHIVEYFYDARKLRKAEGKPLVDIIKSIKQTLYSGQYVDNTGLATRIEINERFSLRQPTAEEMADIKAERKAIEREARANGTWLKAPNGQPTNLTPEQWVNVRTSRFKEWFGDWENDPENASKVVDANGEPMVVYHGSNWKGITTFNRSQSKRRRSGLREYGHFFTTNRALAEMYSNVDDAPEVVEELARLDAQIETAAENKDIDKMLDLYTEKERITRNLGGRVYEVFLNMRDVAEFDADYQADRGWYNLKADVGYKTAIGRDAMEAYAGQNSMTGDRLRKDGIIGRNIIDLFVGTENKEELRPYYDKFGGDVFLVFDPQNIKSATDNAGTYSSENPDIRYSLRLPQYTDAFAALREEYNALDKNDAKELADFRARKRTLVEEYWRAMTDEWGLPCEPIVVDSTNDPEALRPVYDAFLEAYDAEMERIGEDIYEIPSFESFLDEWKKDHGVAHFINGTNKVGMDVVDADSYNTRKSIIQILLHENVHHLIDNNISNRELVRIWRESALTDFGKKLHNGYKDATSAELGNELLAYTIAGINTTDITPVIDYIEGKEGISVENVVNAFENSLPLRNEYAKKILNLLRDGYEKNSISKSQRAEQGGYELFNDIDGAETASYGRQSLRAGRVGGVAGEMAEDSINPRGAEQGESKYDANTRGMGGNIEPARAEGEEIQQGEHLFPESGLAEGIWSRYGGDVIPEFDESPVYSLRDPIEQIRKEGLTRTGRKLDDVNKEDLPAIAEQYGKESVGRKVERAVFNHLVDVERLQENLYAAGVEKADDNDFINAFEAVRNVVAAKMPKEYNNYIQPLLDIIIDLSGKKYGFSYTDVSDYLAAKHSLEREDVSDISTMSTEEGANWTRERCEEIVSEFESKVPAEIQEKLWDAVRAIEKRTLDILLDAGVYTEADIEAIQSHGWEYYVPLQGWDAATENLIEADKIYETPKRGGSTGGKWQEHSAKGRHTKPYDPISTIVSKMNKALYVAETNKALLKLYNLISDGTKVLGKEEASMQFKVSEAYYRNTPEGYVEIDPDDVSQEELKANRELHSELKKLYAERKKIGKYKNVQRWRRYNYELKRANEAGDVERSNKIQERLDSLRQTKGVQLLLEVDAKIADIKSQLTIFIKAGDMAIPREVNPSNELTRARRVYFYLNGRRMYVQFTNPKYSSAINGQTIVQRNKVNNWVGGLNAWLARSFTTNNPEFAFVTNPIRDFRDAMNWHLLDVDNGNMGGFVNHYVFHWNSTRNAIYRAQRGKANPLTSEELKDFNILNKYDRRAIARIYGRDRLLDTLFEWFAENGGVISYSKAFKTPEAAKNFFGQPQKFKASDFNGHANVYKALQDSAEIITRYATFLASLDKGQSVGQAVANGRNVSVNFNRKGELSAKLGAYYQFFNASAQGIYKYIKLARKRPGRFFGLCMYHAVMGYVNSLLIDWLFTSLFPDNDDDELTNVEIPLWERLGYTVFPIERENGKVHTIRIPKSQNMAGFSAIGVLINEVIKGRIAPKEAIEAELNQLAAAWTYGFSEGAPLIRSIIPSGVPQLAFDLWNNTDAFGREIYRTDKYNTRLPAVEFGKKNVIPWVYNVCSAINKAAGGNEYRSSGKLTDINPSAAQYLMEQLSGGYGVLARKGLEFTTSFFYDEVEFEAQNLPALGRVMYTVEPKSWYPEYSTIQKGFDSAAFKNAKSELNAGYITQEEYEDIAKRVATYNGFNKHISALRKLRDDFPSNSGAYRDINREVNRKMGLVTKIFEETDWNAPKYWESIDGVIEKYDPYWRESIDNLFKEYGKKE